MRKIAPFLLSLITLLFAGCETADQKIPQMATDFCNCFTEMEKNMSSKTKDIMEKAANATDPEMTMKDEMDKLSDDEKMSVSTEMMSMGQLQDRTSKVGSCMAAVEKKYDKAKTLDQKKFLEKLIKELESKTGCSFTATLMRIGMRMDDKK